jgi:hypothetical protein
MRYLGPRRSKVVKAAGALLAISLTACGGGSSSSSSTTTPFVVTKADYIARANTVCLGMNARVASVSDGDPFASADGVEQVKQIVSTTREELRTIPIPPGDEATLQDIYSKVDVLIRDYAELAEAMRSGDSSRTDEISAKGHRDQKAANDASNAYGLTVCGS